VILDFFLNLNYLIFDTIIYFCKEQTHFYVEPRTDTQVHPDTLLRWLQKQVALYDKIHIEDMGASFKDGLAICAIIHRYRPDLIDFYSLNAKDAMKNNQLAFDTLEKELNIPPVRILFFLFLFQYHTNHEHIYFSIFNVQTYL